MSQSGGAMASPNKSRRSSTAVPENTNNTETRMSPMPPAAAQPVDPESNDEPTTPVPGGNAGATGDNRKKVNYLSSLYIPTFVYKSSKDHETDNVAFLEEVSKFRKAQAAQRSLQWQFDELSRLYTKLETSNTTLLTDYNNVMKEKDIGKRHMKTMNKEIDRYHFNYLDAEDLLVKSEHDHLLNLQKVDEEKLLIAQDRDSWREKYDNNVLEMEKMKQEYEEKQLRSNKEHDNMLNDNNSKHNQLQEDLNGVQALLDKSEADLTSEKKSLRNTRIELQESQRYAEELRKHSEMLNSKLTEAQHTINELRPWEVRYHGLHDRSTKQETQLKGDNDTLSTENGKIKALLKRMILVFLVQGIKYRMRISQCMTRLGQLNITTSSNLHKLNNSVSANNMEDYDSSVQHQLDKHRSDMHSKMLRIKKVSVMNLLEDLETEVSKTTEPMEELVQKLWVLHHTCNSLQQNSIQKTCDYLDTIEKHEILQKDYKHALDEWKRCDTLYKREQSDKTNLMSRVTILEREIAQHNKNRRYAQGIEALMKEHTKYQNLQEQIALMRRRIDLLKNEKKEEESKLNQYVAEGGDANNYQEETDSQYNMSKPVVLPPFSNNRLKRDQSQKFSSPHNKYGQKGATKTQQQISARQHKFRSTNDPPNGSSPRRSYSKLPITEAKMHQVESVYDQ